MQSAAKLVLSAYGEDPDQFETVQQLVKQAMRCLNPGLEEPSRASEPIRQIVAGLAQVVGGTAELRNRFGTGHGRVTVARLEPRHARLVVGAASTLCTYLLDTLDARRSGTAAPTPLTPGAGRHDRLARSG